MTIKNYLYLLLNVSRTLGLAYNYHVSNPFLLTAGNSPGWRNGIFLKFQFYPSWNPTSRLLSFLILFFFFALLASPDYETRRG
jgi:hypothetical protein